MIRDEKNIVKSENRFCTRCGNMMVHRGIGCFECKNCGYEELDEFGKIKEYIDKNGPSTAIVISNATHISVSIINQYLKEGRIEIPESSEVFIRCEKCGTDIRYGRFCPDCARQLSKELQKTVLGMVGEKPKAKSPSGNKMHFLDGKK